MTSIVEAAPAKINLALHVRRRRGDGYHEIETLFAFCRDGDVVTLEDASELRLDVTGPFASALAGEGDNLVLRAARRFGEAFGIASGCRITLDKRLPVASGIGGGSADAAATLRALARRYGVEAGDPALLEVARGLGADVPACLAGHTALGGGRGDDLRAVAGWSGTPVLLVNPGLAVSTAAVFARWDGMDRGALDPADPASGRNDLEDAARQLAPVIGEVLDGLRSTDGADLVRMSGSGATCFATYRSLEQRDAAAGVMPAAWWTMASELR